MSTPKEHFTKVLETLDGDNIDDVSYKALAAIVQGLTWSEESNAKVKNLGKEIAQEFYDITMMNAEREAYLTSPDNPTNWR